MKQLVILAGGLGTRLAKEPGALPKPMARVAGRPVLEYQLALARAHGFLDVHLLTWHRAELIEDYFGDGSRFGVNLRYQVESQPLGTAGAVLQALPTLGPRFIVLYGDTILDVDLAEIWRRHGEVGADATLLVHPNDHPQDSDLVELDAEGWIRAFHPHPHPPGQYRRNLVNAALYVVEKAALAAGRPAVGKLDFAHQLFPQMLAGGARLHGYRSREYIKDMGTPERLARVERDITSGLVQRLARRTPCPAVFLDRDGTLNVEVNRVKSTAEFELLPDVGPAVRQLNRAGLLAVVITNQPVIARGDCTADELREIHNKLDTLLGADHAYLDALYYCPHHPDGGFPGERADLKIACDCRKPGIGMLRRATADLNVDLPHSWFIGDTTTDLKTARNAGLKAVLVRTGHGGQDRLWPTRPDFEFFNLGEAVDFIQSGYPTLLAEARQILPACTPGSLVAIGGLGRSGKSTWASLLCEVLAERGQRGVVLPLDTWLRGAADRQPGHVNGRFDVPAIIAIVRQLAGGPRTDPVTLQLGHYDRQTRERHPEGEPVTIEPTDVVLFEGVAALLIDELVAAADCAVYVECPERVRRGRFDQEYTTRGLAPAEIATLYAAREVDEHPFVKASMAVARITLGG